VRDRKIIAIVAVGLAAVMLAAAPAVSAKKPKFKAKPALYDPDGTGAVDAAWVTHQGLPGAGKKGKSDHALTYRRIRSPRPTPPPWLTSARSRASPSRS
jgi:hypothetical protein